MKTRHTIIGWALIDEETGELVSEFAGVSVYKTKKSTELSWIDGPLVRCAPDHGSVKAEG